MWPAGTDWVAPCPFPNRMRRAMSRDAGLNCPTMPAGVQLREVFQPKPRYRLRSVQFAAIIAPDNAEHGDSPANAVGLSLATWRLRRSILVNWR
jgi:hypothetical protein